MPCRRTARSTRPAGRRLDLQRPGGVDQEIPPISAERQRARDRRRRATWSWRRHRGVDRVPHGQRFSRTPEKFGTGHIEGVVEASAANNSRLSGAWIPALVFGIPGDSITAIVIGVLYMKGLNPGPAIFIEDPQTIYAVFIIFFLANLLLLPLGWALV